jgi:Uma2 family endonuclease
MADPAIRGMSVDEFLRWEDGTDTRYELVGGFIVAMAPPMPNRGQLALALGAEIRSALRARPPCRAYSEAGIVARTATTRATSQISRSPVLPLDHETG